jgi:hypothetical protein
VPTNLGCTIVLGSARLIDISFLARLGRKLRKPHMFLNGMQDVLIGAAAGSLSKDGCFSEHEPLTLTEQRWARVGCLSRGWQLNIRHLRGNVELGCAKKYCLEV